MAINNKLAHHSMSQIKTLSVNMRACREATNIRLVPTNSLNKIGIPLWLIRYKIVNRYQLELVIPSLLIRLIQNLKNQQTTQIRQIILIHDSVQPYKKNATFLPKNGCMGKNLRVQGNVGLNSISQIG